MKNKGVIIELTALLDVIFIMLFWVMMQLKEQNKNDIQQLESSHVQEIEDINNQHESEINNLNSRHEEEVNNLISEYENQISELQEIAENSGSWEYRQALENFSENKIIKLEYNSIGILDISLDGNELDSTRANSSEIVQKCISDVLENNFKNDDIILCAFIYDGSRSTYQSKENIIEAVENIKKDYNNFYCTTINLNK